MPIISMLLLASEPGLKGWACSMQKTRCLRAVERLCHSDISLLIVFWSVGLLAGTLVTSCFDNRFVSLMHTVVFDRVSIVSRLAAAVLPYLLAALAVNIQKPKLLFLLCLIETFFFALCGRIVFCSYGSAGWLIRLLLMFSDVCLMPVLCWYCIRCICGFKASEKRDLLVCILIAVAVSCIDYFAVSPILAKITDI